MKGEKRLYKDDPSKEVVKDEKPIYQSYINAGVYVLEPDTLKFLKNKQYCKQSICLTNQRTSQLIYLLYITNSIILKTFDLTI